METIKAIFSSPRVKSFLWRTLMMVIAVVVGSVIKNLDLLAPYVNASTITVLGLVLGEVSKWINNLLDPTR